MSKARHKSESALDAGAETFAGSRHRIQVVAAGGPRRRGGISFGRVPVILTMAELGNDREEAEARLKLIVEDPQLSVMPVEPALDEPAEDPAGN